MAYYVEHDLKNKIVSLKRRHKELNPDLYCEKASETTYCSSNCVLFHIDKEERIVTLFCSPRTPRILLEEAPKDE